MKLVLTGIIYRFYVPLARFKSHLHLLALLLGLPSLLPLCLPTLLLPQTTMTTSHGVTSFKTFPVMLLITFVILLTANVMISGRSRPP